MKKRGFTIYVILLIVLDQISKYFFYDQKFLSNYQIFTPSFNTGVSRSIPINLYVVIAISILMTVLILIAYLRQKQLIGKWATILLIGGTIGNLIDRMTLGGVRDFIQIFNRFPVFNLADTFICSGAAVVIIKELFLTKK